MAATPMRARGLAIEAAIFSTRNATFGVHLHPQPFEVYDLKRLVDSAKLVDGAVVEWDEHVDSIEHGKSSIPLSGSKHT